VTVVHVRRTMMVARPYCAQTDVELSERIGSRDTEDWASASKDSKRRRALLRVVHSVSSAYGLVRNSRCLLKDGAQCSVLEITDTLRAIDVCAPGCDMRRIILHFHGGAFCAGSMWLSRELVGRLSVATGARIISVDYRLAPAHPFPAALEDAVTAWRWVCREYPLASIAVAGDSAGGNLSFALLVRLAQLGESQPIACIGMSPWLNVAREGMATSDDGACDSVGYGVSLDMWKGGALRCKERYCKEHPASDPLVSPVLASEALVRKFPPILIHAAEGEPPHLVADARDMASLCQRCGIKTELQLYPERLHVFQIKGKKETSKDSFKCIGAFLTDAW